MFIPSLIMILALMFHCQDPYSVKRQRMVREQIEARGVHHTPTLQAMLKVPRHLFVPEAIRHLAYEDHPLPIGYNQTISQPYIVAYMTAIVEPKPNFKALEIGTGSGYQAAILAEIVDTVFTIEIIGELAASAQERLLEMGYKNVAVRHGDGYVGWPEHAPFDVIIVTAGADDIPPPLFRQLKEGGKMVIPVGPSYSVQSLLLVSKKEGKMTKKTLMPVRFVPFTREKE